MNISATKLLFRKLDCSCVFGLNHLCCQVNTSPSKPQFNSICRLSNSSYMNCLIWKIFSFPLITARHRPQRGEGESGGLESWMLCFTLEKQKSEIRSPYISPCFLLPQKGQQVSQGCSYSATPPGGALTCPLSLAAGQWQRWGGWPAAASGSRLTAPCWGRWSWEQTPWQPWRAGPPPQTGAGQTPWGIQ